MKPKPNNEPKIYANIRGHIYGISRATTISMDEVAACTGSIAKATLYDRLNSPGKFRLGELITIANKFNITLEQLLGLSGETEELW